MRWFGQKVIQGHAAPQVKNADLEKDVSTVMDGQDQSSNSGEVAGPGEAHERDGRHVVDEHLPEILPLHVVELKQKLFCRPEVV